MRATLRPASTLLVVVGLVLAAPACGSDDDATPATTTAAPTTTEAPTTTVDRTEERAALFLAPVLASGGCPAAPATTAPATTAPADTTGGDTTPTSEAPTTTAPATTTTLPPGGPYPTADGVFCYTVGERIGDGNDLTDATLSEAGGAFQVLARVKEESADDLNAGFNRCFTGDPSCPAGEGGYGGVAIIWDGTTLYAPAIQVENLADGPFPIAGGLTEREARKLLTLINR
jgi:hypothetical protein